MLLTIDIGNTTTEWGVFNLSNTEDYELLDSFRLATHKESSSDEFILKLDYSLSMAGFNRKDIHAIICSSVVPHLDHVIEKMGEKYFYTQVHFVRYTDKMDIQVDYPNPSEIGADRLVNANAAFYFYGGNSIIIDFGTATTVCLVNEVGIYIPAMIIPGIKTSLENLISKASKLPVIELTKTHSIIGTTTVESMQTGIYQFTIQGLEGIVAKLKKNVLNDQARVIATGGLGNYIASGTSVISMVDPTLILRGLKRWYVCNHEKTS